MLAGSRAKTASHRAQRQLWRRVAGSILDLPSRTSSQTQGTGYQGQAAPSQRQQRLEARKRRRQEDYDPLPMPSLQRQAPYVGARPLRASHARALVRPDTKGKEPLLPVKQEPGTSGISTGVTGAMTGVVVDANGARHRVVPEWEEAQPPAHPLRTDGYAPRAWMHGDPDRQQMQRESISAEYAARVHPVVFPPLTHSTYFPVLQDSDWTIEETRGVVDAMVRADLNPTVARELYKFKDRCEASLLKRFQDVCTLYVELANKGKLKEASMDIQRSVAQIAKSKFGAPKAKRVNAPHSENRARWLAEAQADHSVLHLAAARMREIGGRMETYKAAWDESKGGEISAPPPAIPISINTGQRPKSMSRSMRNNQTGPGAPSPVSLTSISAQQTLARSIPATVLLAPKDAEKARKAMSRADRQTLDYQVQQRQALLNHYGWRPSAQSQLLVQGWTVSAAQGAPLDEPDKAVPIHILPLGALASALPSRAKDREREREREAERTGETGVGGKGKGKGLALLTVSLTGNDTLPPPRVSEVLSYAQPLSRLEAYARGEALQKVSSTEISRLIRGQGEGFIPLSAPVPSTVLTPNGRVHDVCRLSQSGRYGYICMYGYVYTYYTILTLIPMCADCHRVGALSPLGVVPRAGSIPLGGGAQGRVDQSRLKGLKEGVDKSRRISGHPMCDRAVLLLRREFGRKQPAVVLRLASTPGKRSAREVTGTAASALNKGAVTTSGTTRGAVSLPAKRVPPVHATAMHQTPLVTATPNSETDVSRPSESVHATASGATTQPIPTVSDTATTIPDSVCVDTSASSCCERGCLSLYHSYKSVLAKQRKREQLSESEQGVMEGEGLGAATPMLNALRCMKRELRGQHGQSKRMRQIIFIGSWMMGGEGTGGNALSSPCDAAIARMLGVSVGFVTSARDSLEAEASEAISSSEESSSERVGTIPYGDAPPGYPEGEVELRVETQTQSQEVEREREEGEEESEESTPYGYSPIPYKCCQKGCLRNLSRSDRERLGAAVTEMRRSLRSLSPLERARLKVEFFAKYIYDVDKREHKLPIVCNSAIRSLSLSTSTSQLIKRAVTRYGSHRAKNGVRSPGPTEVVKREKEEESEEEEEEDEEEDTLYDRFPSSRSSAARQTTASEVARDHLEGIEEAAAALCAEFGSMRAVPSNRKVAFIREWFCNSSGAITHNRTDIRAYMSCGSEIIATVTKNPRPKVTPSTSQRGRSQRHVSDRGASSISTPAGVSSTTCPPGTLYEGQEVGPLYAWLQRRYPDKHLPAAKEAKRQLIQRCCIDIATGRLAAKHRLVKEWFHCGGDTMLAVERECVQLVAERGTVYTREERLQAIHNLKCEMEKESDVATTPRRGRRDSTGSNKRPRSKVRHSRDVGPPGTIHEGEDMAAAYAAYAAEYPGHIKTPEGKAVRLRLIREWLLDRETGLLTVPYSVAEAAWHCGGDVIKEAMAQERREREGSEGSEGETVDQPNLLASDSEDSSSVDVDMSSESVDDQVTYYPEMEEEFVWESETSTSIQEYAGSAAIDTPTQSGDMTAGGYFPSTCCSNQCLSSLPVSTQYELRSALDTMLASFEGMSREDTANAKLDFFMRHVYDIDRGAYRIHPKPCNKALRYSLRLSDSGHALVTRGKVRAMILKDQVPDEVGFPGTYRAGQNLTAALRGLTLDSSGTPLRVKERTAAKAQFIREWYLPAADPQGPLVCLRERILKSLRCGRMVIRKARSLPLPSENAPSVVENTSEEPSEEERERKREDRRGPVSVEVRDSISEHAPVLLGPLGSLHEGENMTAAYSTYTKQYPNTYTPRAVKAKSRFIREWCTHRLTGEWVMRPSMVMSVFNCGESMIEWAGAEAVKEATLAQERRERVSRRLGTLHDGEDIEAAYHQFLRQHSSNRGYWGGDAPTPTYHLRQLIRDWCMDVETGTCVLAYRDVASLFKCGVSLVKSVEEETLMAIQLSSKRQVAAAEENSEDRVREETTTNAVTVIEEERPVGASASTVPVALSVDEPMPPSGQVSTQTCKAPSQDNSIQPVDDLMRQPPPPIDIPVVKVPILPVGDKVRQVLTTPSVPGPTDPTALQAPSQTLEPQAPYVQGPTETGSHKAQVVSHTSYPKAPHVPPPLALRDRYLGPKGTYREGEDLTAALRSLAAESGGDMRAVSSDVKAEFIREWFVVEADPHPTKALACSSLFVQRVLQCPEADVMLGRQLKVLGDAEQQHPVVASLPQAAAAVPPAVVPVNAGSTCIPGSQDGGQEVVGVQRPSEASTPYTGSPNESAVDWGQRESGVTGDIGMSDSQVVPVESTSSTGSDHTIESDHIEVKFTAYVSVSDETGNAPDASEAQGVLPAKGPS
ncbi:hypothetical protein KIPB_001252 [Kipferlia bialata]|uniref:Uncharacterized protein n=1 Tax=Kipferlia bialata TaxID=797122 RepID=A0A9K3CQA0_9EUKA|nr:hypothetical protein KIPB_001252 [Kipferlia bialata]|eukprot:g1252.t1